MWPHPFNENSLPLVVVSHIQIAPHPRLLHAHDLNLPELTYYIGTCLADLPSTTHVLMHHDVCQPYYLCTTRPLVRVLMPTLLDETLQAIWAVCIHPGPFTLNGHLDNNLQVSNSCCTLTSTLVRMVRFCLCSHGDCLCRQCTYCLKTPSCGRTAITHGMLKGWCRVLCK